MAPCFDVYVRLPRLDRAVVEAFLERYVENWRETDAWMSDDAATILEAGLAASCSGETLYASKALKHADLEFVMVAFCPDGEVVLGVSVDEADDQDAAEALGARWLDRLLDETGALQGFTQWEEPPPLAKGEWLAEMSRTPYAKVDQTR